MHFRFCSLEFLLLEHELYVFSNRASFHVVCLQCGKNINTACFLGMSSQNPVCNTANIKNIVRWSTGSVHIVLPHSVTDGHFH